MAVSLNTLKFKKSFFNTKIESIGKQNGESRLKQIVLKNNKL